MGNPLDSARLTVLLGVVLTALLVACVRVLA